MSTKAIILHSGGLDSTLCLIQAQRKRLDVISLGIDYGQKHRVELDYASRQCERFNVPRKVLRVEWDKPTLEIPTGRSIDEMRRSVSPAFLPARNAVFLTLACAEAAGIGASEVWIGVNAVDFSGYPDCRPEFILAFRKMIQKAMPPGPKIVAPLLHLSKPQIAKRAYRFGLRRGDVWCCYRPVATDGGVEPCGKCDACLLHEHAWAEALARPRKKTAPKASTLTLCESPGRRRICLVSCVSSKGADPAPARDLYTSPLFRGARRFAETRFDEWYVLSAKHGLLAPDKITSPYDQTLKHMSRSERLAWSQMVFKSLQDQVQPGDQIGFVAGLDYREFLDSMLTNQGIHTEAPLEGMSIGVQLAWFKKFQAETVRLGHLDTFYSLLGELEKGLQGKRRMRECTGNLAWPQMGVYFFFEDGEFRTTTIGVNRVIRVGTHSVSNGSKTTLWNRLRTHRGGADLSGNHRGSVFRLHVGAALLGQSTDPASVPTWAQGQSAPPEIRQAEAELEKQVSEHIGGMSLLWLAIGDQSGPTSDRSFIERNAIALLSGPSGPIDLPSPRWLGKYSPREPIRNSGLWNLNYVADDYDPRFLDTFAEYVEITLSQRRQPAHSIAPNGWYNSGNAKSDKNQLLLFSRE